MPDEIITQGTSREDIGMISTEEELNEILKNEGQEVKTDNDGAEKNLSPPAGADKDTGIEKKEDKVEGIELEDAEKKDDKKEDKDGQEKEYDNLVTYLNDKFDLKMNLDQLPDDLDREKEAEIVGDLYNKLVQGATSKISQYQHIETIIKDKEVASFIKAKSEGKTLKEYVLDYAGSTAGKGNEELVKDDLKSKYAEMSEEDITSTIEGYKDRNMLDKMATIIRSNAIENEKKETEEKQELSDKKVKQDEVDRLAEVESFKTYVGKVNKVYGIPVDQKMKQELFAAATQIDTDGLTYLDKALQSDEGILRATLGLLHLERLIQADKSVTNNRSLNSMVDKLLADPKELQSSSEVKQEEGFSQEIADSF